MYYRKKKGFKFKNMFNGIFDFGVFIDSRSDVNIIDSKANVRWVAIKRKDCWVVKFQNPTLGNMKQDNDTVARLGLLMTNKKAIKRLTNYNESFYKYLSCG